MWTMTKPGKRTRGRPAIGPTLVFRVTEETAQQVNDAAEFAGVPRSAWLREVVERAAGRSARQRQKLSAGPLVVPEDPE